MREPAREGYRSEVRARYVRTTSAPRNTSVERAHPTYEEPMPKPACHKCGAVIPTDMPIGFPDTCDACGADLHACGNCEHYDPLRDGECAAGVGDRIQDRAKANKCSLWEVRTSGAPVRRKVEAVSESQEAARRALAAILGPGKKG